MKTCVFCRIVGGEEPAQVVYQDDDVTAFHDQNPQAPTHILIVPNKHIPNLDAVNSGDVQLVGRLLIVAREIAREKELEAGYRLVVNTGAQGGQSVYHLHVHLLAGRPMDWPPG